MSTISSQPAASPLMRGVGDSRIADMEETAEVAASSTDAVTAAVPDPIPAASEILARLGLAGLRSPTGTADISVLLAQTLLNSEEARSDAQKNRDALAGTLAAGLANRFDPASLEAERETQLGEREKLGKELDDAVAQRNKLKGESDALGLAIATASGRVSEAEAAVAAAKTPEEKKAAQSELDARRRDVSQLQADKAAKDVDLGKAQTDVTTINGQITVVEGKISALSGQIAVLTRLQPLIAAALASSEAVQTLADDTRARSIDLFVEDLFTAIQRGADEGLRSADPLLRAALSGAVDEPDAPPPPPPRPVAVAVGLQIAFADLLRELDRFDPLLLARPPEQTGLDRLRLRV